jgi:hypothetical protein
VVTSGTVKALTQEISNRNITEKGIIMNEAALNLLETKLKKMLNRLDQAKAKQTQRRTRSGTGNIIRRRAGEKEKRFSALGRRGGKPTKSKKQVTD